MSLFITETSLADNPIQTGPNLLRFSIVFSMETLLCEVHRPEVIEHIYKANIQKGDAVLLQGVCTSREATLTRPKEFYIAVNHIELNNILTTKKRKFHQMQTLESMSVDSPPPSSSGSQCENSGSPTVRNESAGGYLIPTYYYEKQSADYTFIEITGCFREYFFMLYGQASYVCEMAANVYSSQSEKQKRYTEMTRMIHNDLVTLLELWEKILKDRNEKADVDRLNIDRFVSTVRGLMMITVDRYTKACQIHPRLPDIVNIDTKIPLPSFIYNHYLN